ATTGTSEKVPSGPGRSAVRDRPSAPTKACKSAMRSMRAGAVAELRVPITASLRSQVQDIIDGAKKVEATLLDIVGHRRVGRVEVAQRAVAFSRENRDR